MGPLIITPHMDDEVLGCASFLLDKGDPPALLYMTYLHPAFPDGEMVERNKELIEWLGSPKVFYREFPGNQLDTIGQHPLMMAIEAVINEVQPDIVLIPHPSFNQDHRAVYDAAVAALRPHDTTHSVKRVLLYEQPEVLGTLRAEFRPTYFRPVDIGQKVKCLEHYPRAIRGHRTRAHIVAFARMRGYQVNMDYAEAFEVLRWVD